MKKGKKKKKKKRPGSDGIGMYVGWDGEGEAMWSDHPNRPIFFWTPFWAYVFSFRGVFGMVLKSCFLPFVLFVLFYFTNLLFWWFPELKIENNSKHGFTITTYYFWKY